MTVAPYETGVPVVEGLEDLDSSDVRIPRLKIMHKSAHFKDTTTGAEYPKIKAVMLGMTKQRLMFAKDVEEGDKPQCKAPDFNTGFPNTDSNARDETRFPWLQSGFDIPTFNVYSERPQDNGHVALPCSDCQLKEWNGKKPPLCAEQFTYALIYCGIDEDEPYMPALLTLQKSSLGAAKSYNSFFVSARKPFFSHHTILGLDAQSRGTVDYAKVTLQRGDGTNPDNWQNWAEQYRGIREVIRSAPRPPEGWEPPVESSNVYNPNADATPAAPVETPAPAPTPAPKPASAPTPAPLAAEYPAPVEPEPAATPPPAPATPPPPSPAPNPAGQAPLAPPQAPATPPASAPAPAAPPTPAPVAQAVPAPAPTPAPAPAAPAPAPVAVAADSADDLPF